MTPRFHLFPFRTQKLSLVVPKILGWRRPGKIGRCRLFSLFGEKPAFSPKYGPLVKRLRRRPLTAKSGVRFSQGSPFLYSAPHLLRLFCTFSSVGRVTEANSSEFYQQKGRQKRVTQTKIWSPENRMTTGFVSICRPNICASSSVGRATVTH